MTNNVLQKFKVVCQIMNLEFIDDLKDNIKDSYYTAFTIFEP